MQNNPQSVQSTPVITVPSTSSPSSPVLSTTPLSDWRGSITGFSGFTGTKPNREQHDVPWDVIRQALAPEQPAILVDKSQGQFFVPCALKEAPFVGNTLQSATKNGQPTTGKMRSKQHVTEATMLVFDVDGMTALDFRAGLAKVTDDGLTLLYYTTFSHGSAEKPGMRARLVIPLDRPIGTEEYAAAWHGFDEHYWGGKAGQADTSGANLYQQQGTWCCHPDRDENAKAKDIQQGVASADALIALGSNALASRSIQSASAGIPARQIRIQPKAGRSTSEATLSEKKKMLLLRVLLDHINPDSGYDKWYRAGMALYTETRGSDEGLALFDDWSSAGKQKYDGSAKTTAKWRSFRLDVENPCAIGTLFHFAKENGFSPDMIYAEVEWLEICGGEQDAA